MKLQNIKQAAYSRTMVTGAILLGIFSLSTRTILALPIVGYSNFSGKILFDTASAATATEVVVFNDSYVVNSVGSMNSIINGAGVNFTTSWIFNDSTTINSFWTVGGYTFQLLSSNILTQGGTPGVTGFVTVGGSGILSGNGFDPTYGSWSFTTQDPGSGTPAYNTFSASITAVPEPSTWAMLAGGFGALLLYSRRRG